MRVCGILPKGVQASPDRLAVIEDRLAALERLKRKYGPSLAEVIRFGEEAAARLNEVENRDELLEELRATREAQARSYLAAAKSLSEARRAAAERLRKRAETAIGELAMRARLGIAVEAQVDDQRSWNGHGYDAIGFLIATNAGEPLKPLEEVGVWWRDVACDAGAEGHGLRMRRAGGDVRESWSGA